MEIWTRGEGGLSLETVAQVRTHNKARHATPTTLRLRLHSVGAHAASVSRPGETDADIIRDFCAPILLPGERKRLVLERAQSMAL